ncbi:MAG: hypothetical protein GXO87_00075 [Chlorobi bacterium]|nr:hypothetical protein [Chlorobiota bacterium]
MKRKTKRIFFVLLFVAIITPLGLLTNNPAWGEWDKSYFAKALGFIPKGIQKASEIVAPLFQNYTVYGNSRIANQYFSAIIGVVIIFAFFYLIKVLFNSKYLKSKKNKS